MTQNFYASTGTNLCFYGFPSVSLCVMATYSKVPIWFYSYGVFQLLFGLISEYNFCEFSLILCVVNRKWVCMRIHSHRIVHTVEAVHMYNHLVPHDVTMYFWPNLQYRGIPSWSSSIHYLTVRSFESLRLSHCGLLWCTLTSYLFGSSPLAFMSDVFAAYSCQLVTRGDLLIRLENPTSLNTVLFNDLVQQFGLAQHVIGSTHDSRRYLEVFIYEKWLRCSGSQIGALFIISSGWNQSSYLSTLSLLFHILFLVTATSLRLQQGALCEELGAYSKCTDTYIPESQLLYFLRSTLFKKIP